MLIPSLIYCSTDRCDMRCSYCPTEGSGSYGENFEISRHPLTSDEVVWTANVIGSLGFHTFRLTGGEPLLNPQRATAILQGIAAGGQFQDIRLNTNGSRLSGAVAGLRSIPGLTLKVSLDTLDPVLFERITSSKKHRFVVDGIEKAAEAGLAIAINAVLTQETAPGMLALAQWCQARRIQLKILDVVRYDSQEPGYIAREKVQLQEVGDLHRDLEEAFGPPEITQLSGGRGIYMKRYGDRPGVLFKDCAEGTTYTAYCHGCPHFPCEEGIHNLSLSTDGHLRPCRIRSNVFWEMRPIIAARDEVRLARMVEELISRMFGGEFSARPLAFESKA